MKFNPVEEYLSNNKGKKLSIKNISKQLNLKKRTAIYFANKSKLIRNINPIEVGSGKYKINVYTFIH